MNPLRGFDRWLERERDDYCALHPAYLMPCRACRAIAMIEDAALRADQKRDEQHGDD